MALNQSGRSRGGPWPVLGSRHSSASPVTLLDRRHSVRRKPQTAHRMSRKHHVEALVAKPRGDELAEHVSIIGRDAKVARADPLLGGQSGPACRTPRRPAMPPPHTSIALACPWSVPRPPFSSHAPAELGHHHHQQPVQVVVQVGVQCREAGRPDRPAVRPSVLPLLPAAHVYPSHRGQYTPLPARRRP